MKWLPDFLRDARLLYALAAFAVLALCVIVFGIELDTGKIGARDLAILAAVFAIWLAFSLLDWQRIRRRARAWLLLLTSDTKDVSQPASAAPLATGDTSLHARVWNAVHRIRTSSLAVDAGRDALYELPWALLIGSPGAGKSTAVRQSGLDFPLAEQHGTDRCTIPPTEDCAWHFTKQGIVLDTAGSYVTGTAGDHAWTEFLASIRKCRPKVPVNAIVIAVSIADLLDNDIETTIAEAKRLRQRMQEITNQLEVLAPVYVMFTKVDVLAGFQDFFGDAGPAERKRVWGATLSCAENAPAGAMPLFDQHFAKLLVGLEDMGKSIMADHRGGTHAPGILAFPIEFAGLRQVLRTFIGALFDDNPFQIRPVFRGFYFTSALPQGTPVQPAARRLARQFGLDAPPDCAPPSGGKFGPPGPGYFICDLFTAVIFPDRDVAHPYLAGKRQSWRRAGFHAAVLALGLLLGGWTWSYINNRQYITNIGADLDKAVRLQQGRADVIPRLDALLILQDRLEQLQQYRHDKPWALGFGLYQGGKAERRLRDEYFAGVRQFMLAPVTASLEQFLTDVNAASKAGVLEAGVLEADASGQSGPNGVAGTPVPSASSDPDIDARGMVGSTRNASPYANLSSTNQDAAYNALKTYLMLAQKDRIDPGHLGDQITRFWRGWLESQRGEGSREQLIRGAEKLIRFYLSQCSEADFPLIENRLALVDQTRETLRRRARATPPGERVYQEIKSRASTRFPAVTVAGMLGERDATFITGSHAIPGTFTRAAWENFVEAAIKDASTKESHSVDWVLKTSTRDDLSLEGSPEQIRKDLTRMYKEDYVREWKKFMQGIAVTEFRNFDQAVIGMNRLGDPVSSPFRQLVQHLHRETAWDDPAPAARDAARAGSDLLAWIGDQYRRVFPDPGRAGQAAGETQTSPVSLSRRGLIAGEFAAIERLVAARGEARNGSLLNAYLDQLGRLRTRLNQIRISGDPGPASRQLMQATFDGTGSELTDALKYVDDAMLSGASDGERAMLRPLLVRPLMQAFAVLVQPAEQELNKTWHAQVALPFHEGIGAHSPFTPGAKEEAVPADIARIFGPDGAIARFVQTALAPLVTRRGDVVTPRTWAGMGIQLHPRFADELPRYLAASGLVEGRLPAPASVARAEKAAPGRQQTRFQFQPVPAAGLQEYTVEIDGQSLRYRNGPQEWMDFIWPGDTARAGARISAVAADGRPADILNFPGPHGLEMLVNAAERSKIGNGMHRLTWTGGGHRVALNFRRIAEMTPPGDAAQGPGSAGGSGNAGGFQLPASVTLAGGK